MSRYGSRLLTDSATSPELFRPDLGEDWVVPRTPVRYLVVQANPQGALLTAYGPEGAIVGERFGASINELLQLLEAAAARGDAEVPRLIPCDTDSALAWLDGRTC